MMKVVILRDTELLWERSGGEQPFGIACANYGEDGTQIRIVAALADALSQAKSELALYEADAVLNCGASVAEMKDDIPVAWTWCG